MTVPTPGEVELSVSDVLFCPLTKNALHCSTNGPFALLRAWAQTWGKARLAQAIHCHTYSVDDAKSVVAISKARNDMGLGGFAGQRKPVNHFALYRFNETVWIS
jgi:hypothetical protein